MKIALIVCAAAAVVAPCAGAQSAGTAPLSSQRVAAASAAPATEGVVRKVDRQQGRLTLQHGRIENLGMPGMTMVFKAASPKLLDGLKEGDKVTFAADNVEGVLTVTAIEAVR